jgi:DNA-directed RNA polymerase subunit RPC12/RpoP
MTQGTVGVFRCSACGKQHIWRAVLAGRKISCSCGRSVVVPVAPTAPGPQARAPQAARARQKKARAS